MSLFYWVISRLQFKISGWFFPFRFLILMSRAFTILLTLYISLLVLQFQALHVLISTTYDLFFQKIYCNIIYLTLSYILHPKIYVLLYNYVTGLWNQPILEYVCVYMICHSRWNYIGYVTDGWFTASFILPTCTIFLAVQILFDCVCL